MALEEILQNALVHREYIKTAPIRLLIFDNRVEIISPGALADGLTVDDIKLGITFQRNQLIAGFCAKTMLYRGLGSGLLRAHKDGAKMQFINSESGKQFTTVIYRDTTLMNENLAQKDKELAQKKGCFAQMNESLAPQKALLAQMKEDFAQINESVAQKIAELAQKNELTDLQVNILKYIALHSTVSRADLANKIVDATIDKVKHSLTRLQDLGILLRQGSKRSGHWEILFD